MEQEKTKVGTVRRAVVAIIAGVGVILLGWNVIDGTIHYRRAEIALTADPVTFWFTSIIMLLAFGAAFYWAVWGGGQPEATIAPRLDVRLPPPIAVPASPIASARRKPAWPLRGGKAARHESPNCGRRAIRYNTRRGICGGRL